MEDEKRSVQILEENRRLISAIAELSISNLHATLLGQIFLKASCIGSISSANNILYLNTDTNRFATLSCGTLNTKTHLVSYCKAEEIIQNIGSSVKEQSCKVAQSDDITIMIIKRN